MSGATAAGGSGALSGAGAGGALGGTLAGGASGSVLPGVGTALGALGGLASGIFGYGAQQDAMAQQQANQEAQRLAAMQNATANEYQGSLAKLPSMINTQNTGATPFQQIGGLQAYQ